MFSASNATAKQNTALQCRAVFLIDQVLAPITR
jgi:hypothetical protein